MADWLQEWRHQEASSRHGAAIFLTLYSLVGLDIFSIKDQKAQQQATAMWVGWGIIFFMIAMFIITPEQEALRKQQQALT